MTASSENPKQGTLHIQYHPDQEYSDFTMSNPRTLNELTELKNSGFGRPSPRHGLKLLYWFANDFVFVNNNDKMCWQYDPKNQFYGFHRFRNREDKNGVKLLPDVKLVYYMVGNLNSAGADELPFYVREEYGNFKNRNNMDRIIVSIDGQRCDRVYVTEHCDRKEFSKEATHCISKELIMIIRDMTLEDFLLKTGYLRAQKQYSQRSGFSRQQEQYSQRSGFSRQQEQYSQRSGFSRQQEQYSQRSGFSRPHENTGHRSDEVDNFWDDNESTNCCRCVIL